MPDITQIQVGTTTYDIVDTIARQQNQYVLPIASTTTLGGIKINNDFNINENGIISITNYLSLSSGGTVKGNIILFNSESTSPRLDLKTSSGSGASFIQAYTPSDAADGQNILRISSGGNLILGSGEASRDIFNYNIKVANEDGKRLYLGSDEYTYIITGINSVTSINTIDNAKIWTFDNNGTLTLPGKLSLSTAGLSSALDITNGGTGAISRTTAVENLTYENVGTDATSFLTITDDWANCGYTKTADAKTVLGLGSLAYKNSLVASDIPELNASKITAGTLSAARGGTGQSSIADFMKTDLRLNYGTISVSTTKEITYPYESSIIVIFWMRSGTCGVAVASGYNATVTKLFDSNNSSPTFTMNTSTKKIAMTNNRNSTIAIAVIGGTIN